MKELLLKFFGGGRDQNEDFFFVKVGCVVVMCDASPSYNFLYDVCILNPSFCFLERSV